MPRFTGIIESAWLGRYWARWNDAVAEAGLEPNAWNLRTHEESALVARLAQFTLDLGHYPTGPEQNLAHRQDPTFPDAKAFSTYVGRRHEQIQKLMEYAVQHPEFGEVHDICAPLAAAPDERSIAPKTGQVDVVHTLETDDPEGIERYWHERFASKRLNGEWFRLTAQDVAVFKRRGKFM